MRAAQNNQTSLTSQKPHRARKHNLVRGSVLLVLLVLALPRLAQTQSSSNGSDSDSEGKELSGYQVQQTIELGYRFNQVTGSPSMYDTLIDQHEGLRLLDQSLSMRSPNRTGVLFDDLSVSSFGWGGDPENVARIRVSKTLVYDFNFLFRRDQNFFDYDLLANPLNPATSNPNIPVLSSPHEMHLRRRMYDAGLTLFPESKFSVRLGYSRNRSEGPSLSSFHEGTDVSLNQAWNVSSNDYRIGFDFKALPRTTISYDQVVDTDKNDTDYSLFPFAAFPLSNGTIVSFGLPINTAAGSPCNTPLIGGVANPVCNAYIDYSRVQRVRTITPTEQLSFQSNYSKRVNLVGRASYSSGELTSPYNEFFNGFVTRTNQRQFTFTGPADVHRRDVSLDLGATVTLTQKLALSDNFRYDDFHIPGIWDSSETAIVAGGAPPFSLLSPLGAATTTPDFVANFLSQKTIMNLVQLEWTASKRFGGHIGYRLRHRLVFKSEPELLVDPESGLGEFEGDLIAINEHSPVIGVWLRPVDSLQINADVELMTADNFITRVSPRQSQTYKVRVRYRPRPWATVAATTNIMESRNGEADTQFSYHYRNAGLTTSLLPAGRWGVDVSYNFTDSQQDAFICYNGNFNPGGAVVNGCPTFNASANPNPNLIYSNYSGNTHYFSGTIRFKPIKPLTASFGYGVTRNDGGATILNTLQPLGPLEYTYHQPLAQISYDVMKGFSLNAYWNYDQYNETNSFVGPTLPRYFHDNRTVVSAKYSF